MSLLLFLKPIYQDSNDPGPPTGEGLKKKKRKKLTKRIIEIVQRQLPEVRAKEDLQAKIAEQEKLATKIQALVWERIQKEQAAYEEALTKAELERAQLHKRRKEEDEILLLLLKDIL